MSVFKRLTTYEPDEISTNPKIRRLFETHRQYLKNHKSTRVHIVNEGEARPYAFNLFAYLNSKKIPTKLHWIILLISDLRSPEDFSYDTRELLIPDQSEVDKILAMSNL